MWKNQEANWWNKIDDNGLGPWRLGLNTWSLNWADLWIYRMKSWANLTRNQLIAILINNHSWPRSLESCAIKVNDQDSYISAVMSLLGQLLFLKITFRFDFLFEFRLIIQNSECTWISKVIFNRKIENIKLFLRYSE